MKDIKEFEGQYSITDDGKIWSHRIKNFLKLRGSGISGKTHLRHKRKYQTVAFWKRGFGYKYFYVHRLVAQTFIPNPKNLPMVNHKDGNQENNNVDNLEWCTHKENAKHAFLNGLTTRGQKNSQCKLTNEQVLEIKRRYFSTQKSRHIKRQELLASEFGVCVGTIRSIVQGVNWKWLNTSEQNNTQEIH